MTQFSRMITLRMFAVVRMSNVVFGIAISIISFGMGDSDDRISQDLRKYLVAMCSVVHLECHQWCQRFRCNRSLLFR